VDPGAEARAILAAREAGEEEEEVGRAKELGWTYLPDGDPTAKVGVGFGGSAEMFQIQPILIWYAPQSLLDACLCRPAPPPPPVPLHPLPLCLLFHSLPLPPIRPVFVDSVRAYMQPETMILPLLLLKSPI
jgi:hypothetical protein